MWAGRLPAEKAAKGELGDLGQSVIAAFQTDFSNVTLDEDATAWKGGVNTPGMSESRFSSLLQPTKGNREAFRAGASPGPVWCSDLGVAMTHYRWEPFRLLGRSHQPHNGGTVSPERFWGQANSIATLAFRLPAHDEMVNLNGSRKL